MSRKALFFDIDGTLLSEKTHTVPQSAVWAMSESRKRGHLVFINSGRTLSLIGPVQKMIEADGYLCGCGTYILAGGEVIYSHTIPYDRRQQLKHDILSHGLDAVLEGVEGCYLRKETSWIPRIEEFRTNFKKNGYLSPYSWDDDSCHYDKFCAIADENSDLEGFFESMKPDMEVIDRGDNFYECVPKGHSKATAIEKVLERYHIPLEDAYVFGDSSNDLSMFQYAKHAILMGVHDPILEPYATFITKEVEEDGIEYALKQLGLL